MLNNITVQGNLGGDVEVKDVNGTTLVKGSLACSQKVKSETHTDWFYFDLWGKLGAAMAPYLTKGKQVIVSGRMVSNKSQDGKIYWSIRANSIDFAGNKADNQSAQSGQLPSTMPPAGHQQVIDDDIPF